MDIQCALGAGIKPGPRFNFGVVWQKTITLAGIGLNNPNNTNLTNVLVVINAGLIY